MKIKLKTVLKVATVVCEATVIVLGVAALCTPAAGIVIAATAIGTAAWLLSKAEEATSDTYVIDNTNNQATQEAGDDDDDLFSEGNTDSILNSVDSTTPSALEISDVELSGNQDFSVVEV